MLDSHCPASWSRCGYGTNFLVCSFQVHPLAGEEISGGSEIWSYFVRHFAHPPWNLIKSITSTLYTQPWDHINLMMTMTGVPCIRFGQLVVNIVNTSFHFWPTDSQANFWPCDTTCEIWWTCTVDADRIARAVWLVRRFFTADFRHLEKQIPTFFFLYIIELPYIVNKNLF
jgi:hypothetical protein